MDLAHLIFFQFESIADIKIWTEFNEESEFD